MGLYHESVSVMRILDFGQGHGYFIFPRCPPHLPVPPQRHFPILLTVQKISPFDSNLVAGWWQLPNPNFLLPGEHFDG